VTRIALLIHKEKGSGDWEYELSVAQLAVAWSHPCLGSDNDA